MAKRKFKDTRKEKANTRLTIAEKIAVAVGHMAGKSERQIRDATGVPRRTVHDEIQRIDDLGPTTLARIKKELSERWNTVTQQALGMLDTELKAMVEAGICLHPRDLAIISGIGSQRLVEVTGINQPVLPSVESMADLASRLLAGSSDPVKRIRVTTEIEATREERAIDVKVKQSGPAADAGSSGDESC